MGGGRFRLRFNLGTATLVQPPDLAEKISSLSLTHGTSMYMFDNFFVHMHLNSVVSVNLNGQKIPQK